MYITREPLSGNFKAKFILIKDSKEASGIRLLKAVVNTLLKENVQLRVIYYELMNISLLSELNAQNSNVNETDAVSDPFGWNKSINTVQNLRSLSALNQLCSESKGVICFDSLSPMLFDNDPNDVYKVLHKILTENSDLQIIALMHSDVHNPYENDIMSKLSTTVLSVISGDTNKCLSTTHFSSGKVSCQLMEYEVNDAFQLSVFREFHPQVKATSSKQPDPTANLTFNLRLKENEKEARSHVQLPYMQMQNKEIIETEIDMYDEEDPDDDLDI